MLEVFNYYRIILKGNHSFRQPKLSNKPKSSGRLEFLRFLPFQRVSSAFQTVKISLIKHGLPEYWCLVLLKNRFKSFGMSFCCNKLAIIFLPNSNSYCILTKEPTLEIQFIKNFRKLHLEVLPDLESNMNYRLSTKNQTGGYPDQF